MVRGEAAVKSVLYLVKNNVRHKNGAFISIILLMAMIVFSFSCSVSNSKNLDEALNDSLDHYQVGDLVMTFKEADLTEDITQEIESNSHVKSWRSEPLLFVAMECYLNGEGHDYETRLVKEKDEIKVFKEDFDGFYEKPPKLEEGQVYIAYSLAKVNDLEAGDTLEIQTSPDTRETFEIKGIVEDPLYGSSVVAYEIFFISAQDYDRIAKGIDDGTVNNNYIYKTQMLHIFSDGKLEDFKLVKELNDQCGLVDRSYLYVTRSELAAYTAVYSDTGTSLVYAFVALLCIVVALMVLGNINSTIEMQYVDLGILKSQGFTLWQIRLSFLLQYIIAQLIGTVIGLIISVPILMVMGKIFMTVTGIYTSCRIDFVSCSIISLCIIAVFAVFIIIATRKLAKLSPVNALNNAHKDVHFTSRLNLPMHQRGLSLSISTRNLTSGFRHYVVIILISVILTFFMITVVNLCRGLNFKEMFSDPHLDAGAVLFNEFQDSDKQRLTETVSAVDPDPEIVYSGYVDNILADDVLYGVTACDHLERYYKPIDGRMPKYDNEVIITRIVADELEKGVGDSITVSNRGTKEKYKIVGVIQTTSQAGRTFCMTLEGGKKLGIKPVNVNIYLSDSSNADAVAEAINTQLKDIAFAKAYNGFHGADSLVDMVDVVLALVMGIVIGVSSVFLLAAVSMICKMTFLRERTDLGIFKATGFTTGNLRAQFSIRFLLMGIIGCVIGIGCAAAFTKPILSKILRIIGITDFAKSITLFDIAIPVSVICICFILFSFISSSRIKRVSTTELICE